MNWMIVPRSMEGCAVSPQFDGFIIPMSLRNGLPYIPMRSYTDKEFNSLPHVIMTGQRKWDSLVLDEELVDCSEEWFDAVTTQVKEDDIDQCFDNVGNYRHGHIVTSTYTRENQEEDVFHDAQILIESCNHQIKPGKVDYEKPQPKLGWAPIDVIQRTFDATTQFVKIPMSNLLRKTFQSPNPAVNVPRRNEPVATDTIFLDATAIDSGCKCAQLFKGTKSQVVDAYGRKYSDREFVKDMGAFVMMPDSYKKINVHLVYAVKHAGRFKARLVANGNLTDVPVDSVYSGVVSLLAPRMIIFLAELNNLELWATDIGNAYLEATTKKKSTSRQDQNSGRNERVTFSSNSKRCMASKSSGLRWHEKLSDAFVIKFPSHVRQSRTSGCGDIWMSATNMWRCALMILPLH
jgi:hypothetical protein